MSGTKWWHSPIRFTAHVWPLLTQHPHWRDGMGVSRACAAYHCSFSIPLPSLSSPSSSPPPSLPLHHPPPPPLNYTCGSLVKSMYTRKSPVTSTEKWTSLPSHLALSKQSIQISSAPLDVWPLHYRVLICFKYKMN